MYSRQTAEVITTGWSQEMSHSSLYTSNDFAALEDDGSLSEHLYCDAEHTSAHSNLSLGACHKSQCIQNYWAVFAYMQSANTTKNLHRIHYGATMNPKTGRFHGSPESVDVFQRHYDAIGHKKHISKVATKGKECCHFCVFSFCSHFHKRALFSHPRKCFRINVLACPSI